MTCHVLKIYISLPVSLRLVLFINIFSLTRLAGQVHYWDY